MQQKNFSAAKKKILMVGYGNMGKPIGERIANTLSDSVEITIVNPSPRQLLDGMKFFSAEKNLPHDEKYDILLLAIKPQNAASIAPSYEQHLTENAIIFSIMAGISCDTIRRFFKNERRVIRIMPNVCANIGKSSTALALKKNDSFSAAENEFICRLISSFGEIIAIDEEKIDAITALVGSGPAYVFYLFELVTFSLTEQCDLNYSEAKNLLLKIANQPISENPTSLSELENKGSMRQLIKKTFANSDKKNVAPIVEIIVANFAQAFVRAARSLDFSESDAKKLVHNLIKNSTELAKFFDKKSFNELQESVTSKNGTTFHGLAQLTSACSLTIDEIFKNTVQAAYNRAKEIGKNLNANS